MDQSKSNSCNERRDSCDRSRGTRRLRKKNYEKLNDETRKQIIFEVTILGEKLKNVCEKLNINVSSAKNVLSIYKKEGRIEKKKYRVKRRKTEENEVEVNDDQPEQSSSNVTLTSMPSTNPSYPAPSSQNPSMPNPPTDLSLNDQCIYYLFQNYCMCPNFMPGMSLATPNTITQEYFKSMASLFQNGFAKYLSTGM